MMTIRSLRPMRRLFPACRVLLVALAASILAPSALAASSGYPLEDIDVDPRDLPSLQRGARLYVDYCLGCHSLKFQRYERTADDLAIPHDVAMDTLVFTGQKIGSLMTNAIPEDSKAWFGGPPPDLTMVTRVRGDAWVYTYLKTFYVDELRPLGVNNEVFPNVGMPHALLDLQGVQRKGCIDRPVLNEAGAEKRDPLVPGKAVMAEKCGELFVEPDTGTLTAEEYDQAVFDLVNFMAYVAEPAKLDRQRIGVYVLIFLLILFVFAYLLNREYWKDIH